MRPPIFLFFLLITVSGTYLTGKASTDTAVSFVSKTVIVSDIQLKGNRITKPAIILRELTFRTGDTIETAQFPYRIQRSRENLLNTSLFNFVTVDTVFTGINTVTIHFTFAERWYTFPIPIFEIYERNVNTWLENPNLSRANYGFYIQRDNFRGRKETVELKVRFGYAEQYGILYDIPYIDARQRNGMGFSFSYNRGHEIMYQTFFNTPQFYKNNADYVHSEYVGRAYAVHRQGLYLRHLLYLDYYNGTVADTIRSLTNDYYMNNLSSMNYLTLGYTFRSDHRDFKPYPLNGYYFEATLAKQGMGLLKNESLDNVFIAALFRKYWPLGGRFYMGSAVKARTILGARIPFFVQRSLGYGTDLVRGYEYYVVDGQSFFLAKANLRYQLVKTRIQKIPFLSIEKFNTFHYTIYLSLYADAGYVNNQTHQQGNNLANRWLSGNGVGIDFVTYYDTVFRAEFSVNARGERGVFLHYIAPL